MWLIILGSILALLVYYKIKKSYQYWEDKGVPYLEPFLVFGNLAPTVFRRCAFAHALEDIYKSYPDKRYIGIYQFLRPTLMLRSPELIKQITVKDFDFFPDHGAFSTGEADPLFNRNLLSLTSENGWHDMRATLSPAFTSSKMRTMFTLMQQCSEQFVSYFKNQKGTTIVELKDVFTRFGNDVIGTTAFGVTCDSLNNRDNEFYLMGRDATDFSGLRSLRFFGYSVVPLLMKAFKIKMIPKKTSNFFRRLIKETLEIREKQNIVRPDMIHLLMEARKGRLKDDNQDRTIDSGFAVAQEYETGKNTRHQKEITEDDITAQAFIFFLGGFDTTSNLISYVAYELAINTDVQERLGCEVERIVEGCTEKITYEALLGMKYLDNVVSETLRLHSPGLMTERKCVKPYTIQPEHTEEKPVHLDKGTIVWIPIYPIQMDSKYYPDPQRFDPERFNDENKHKIKSFTYLPFGAGPRNCIGSRFALLETKLIIVELLRFFQMIPVAKTKVPLILSQSDLNPLPKEGIWIGLKRR